MPAAKTAIEMRENFGEEAAALPQWLESFFNRMFAFEINHIEGAIADLAPTTVALFQAIEGQIETAQLILVEKLTADDNLERFTAGTENGIAKDMPVEMIPLVISALAEIAAISKQAHQQYEAMIAQLPPLLLELKESLVQQAAIAQASTIDKLEAEKTILKKAQPTVTTATADVAHNSTQQHKIGAQTSWMKTRIKLIDQQIKNKKQALREFMTKHNFLEIGARQLATPLGA